MNNLVFMVIFGFGFFLPACLLSQQKSISLAECLSLAQQHSHVLKQENQKIQAARAAERSAESRYLPYLYAEFSYNMFLPRSDNYTRQSSSGVLDWSPGNWLKKTARTAARQIQVEQAEKEVTLLALTRRVSALYLGILRNQQELKLLERRLAILREHRQVAEALHQGGIRTELDVLQTRAAISSLKETKIVRQAERKSLQTALALLLDFHTEDTLSLKDFPARLIDEPPFFDEDPRQDNPLIKSLQLQAETRQLLLGKVQALYWPTVQLHGGSFRDTDPNAEGNYWQTGISIKAPLFRWGELKFKQQEITARVKILKWQKAEVQRELTIQLADIKQKFTRLHHTYLLLQDRQKITSQALEIATANYQAGLTTNLEYLAAQEQNVTTKVSLNETRLAYVLCRIEYYILTNKPEKIKMLQGV